MYSKPTLSNNKETEKKYIINHKKNDMSTPIFEIVETESIKNVTISSFIVTTGDFEQIKYDLKKVEGELKIHSKTKLYWILEYKRRIVF